MEKVPHFHLSLLLTLFDDLQDLHWKEQWTIVPYSLFSVIFLKIILSSLVFFQAEELYTIFGVEGVAYLTLSYFLYYPMNILYKSISLFSELVQQVVPWPCS